MVCSSYLPDSSPLASGTRAMMPTPAPAAAGSTASSGLSRNMFRMICTLATRGPGDRGQRLLDGLDADAVGRDALLGDHLVECVEDRVVLVDRRRRGSAAAPGRGCRRPGWPASDRSRRGSWPGCSSPAPARPGGPSWSRPSDRHRRRSRSSRPTRRSLRPSPYTSAVSMNVTPASTAAFRVASASSSLDRTPVGAQLPGAETDNADRPGRSGRGCAAPSVRLRALGGLVAAPGCTMPASYA